MGLGLIPGGIVFVAMTGALLSLIATLGSLSRGMVAHVVNDDNALLADLLTWLVGAALVGAAVLLALYTFTALTLFIGQPFFERISVEVDALLGAPSVRAAEPWWRAFARGVGEAIRILGITLLFTLALFLVGLIPVVGTVTAFVLGVLLGGWFLALELTTFALSRRGTVSLKQRRALLATKRSVSLGFGSTVFLLFLVPFGAVATMPAAVVGATLLARALLGEPDQPTSGSGSPAVSPISS
jgi:CysZ protein